MKQLAALTVLLIVLGLAAFFYRYEIERPTSILNPGSSGNISSAACTDEAKVCPDGSAVGRSGPNCAFAACPLPNIELTNGSTTIGFVLPAGYAANLSTGEGDMSLLATYQKPALEANVSHVITVHVYDVPTGQTPEQVMIATTVFDPSGITATSTSQLKQVTIGGKTFYSVVLERFEGQVHSAYYLLGADKVLRFEVLERDVTNWSDANLATSLLPEHQALAHMLATLQVTGL